MPEHTWLEVLGSQWWIALVALGVSLVVTPVFRFIAYRTGIVDRPDAALKPHRRPVAYLGGAAIWIGFLAGLIGLLIIRPDLSMRWPEIGRCLLEGRFGELLENPLWNLLAVALASLTILVVGLLDDLLNIRPKHKVAGQVLVGIILFVGGVGTRMGTLVLSPLGLHHLLWLLLPLSAVMLLVMTIAICNAANLLDGLDGLCGGVT
ncbi:unnamed protein product, partial [marine sediment metagenome]